ncbi:MAG TPA: S8 family serine peptidase [Longimicrobiaceae bacterium]|nr:S8 family serine peptidase [Longimicrobiaceae bacterium]
MANVPRRGDVRGNNSPTPLEGPRELIVVSHREAGLRAGAAGVASVGGADVTPLRQLLAAKGVSIRPLFGTSEERILRAAESAAEATGTTPPDLSVFYRVDAPDARLDELAAALREQDVVDAAYVKPPVSPAVLGINDMVPAAADAPPVTADFTARQGYLNAAPAGVDARWGWTRPGGSGADVRIIDIEGAWRFTHEDLVQAQGGVVAGTPIAHIGWRNHGTAVIGEFSGDRNSFGITGICPDAIVSAVSFNPNGSAWAIRQAADRLRRGDVILIELHRAGPRFNFQGRPQDQLGYIAIEWWPDDFQAIQYAVGRGVIVVEAAGNGWENLNDPIYDNNPPPPFGPFPTWWSNPFRRSPLDSGAIIVGAGAPPPGTHGSDWGPDRSRLDFSNHGAVVDAQGWGHEVTTAGYGDLQGGTNEDLWYTDQFSGTSSASPIVVGSVAAVQGALKAAGRAPLTPAQARNILRTTGSPQQDGPHGPATQRIGNRPNIRQMVEQLLPPGVQTVPLYRYWNPGIGDHFYTTDWAELGGGRYGWAYEGIQCYVLPRSRTGAAPLYRYWNPGIGDHFYTTNWAELGSGGYGWAFERIQCYVPVSAQSGSIPVYRYWNPGIGDHFYTTSWAELGGGRYGWTFEMVQCYAWPSAVTLPPSAAPEAPAEAAPAGAEAEEPVTVGVKVGIPLTFRMGAAPAEEGREEQAPSFVTAAPQAGHSPEGVPSSFAVPFTGIRRKGENGGRSRPVKVTFTVSGEDEE